MLLHTIWTPGYMRRTAGLVLIRRFLLPFILLSVFSMSNDIFLQIDKISIANSSVDTIVYVALEFKNVGIAAFR